MDLGHLLSGYLFDECGEWYLVDKEVGEHLVLSDFT